MHRENSSALNSADTTALMQTNFRFWSKSALLVAGLVLLTGCAVLVHQQKGDREGFDTDAPWQLSLDGQWYFVPAASAPEKPYLANLSMQQWHKLDVPGNWYLDGHDLAGAGFYKRKFSLPAMPADGVARISFEAVDYAADVWVNEVWVGRHQGYFDEFSFDITSLINSEGPHDLTVRVDSPEESADDWSLNKRLIKGVLSHHDTRPGGAWSSDGQDANTGGIWGSVRVDVSRRMAIDHIGWHDDIKLEDNTAETQLTLRLAEAAKRRQRLELVVSERHSKTRATKTFRKNVVIAPGQRSVNMLLGRRSVDLWQPWETGSGALYDYSVSIKRKGVRLATKKVSRGIRSIERDAETGQWRVNGKRIFLRGTNYIPSQWLSEMTTQRFRHDIDLMLKANINAVRVHAMVLPQRFYDLANEAGLMVWQDFPLQWGYSDDAVFHAEAKRQLSRMIHQFGHHPSIIAWSMHNEPPWEASWMQYKYPDYDPDQNRELDQMLSRVARDLDSSRHVHEASLTAEHPWFGWYSGSWRDYAKPTKESLITEFGAQALPHRDTFERIFPATQKVPVDEAGWNRWRYHNFQRRETFDIALVEPAKTVTQLIENTQAYQARLVQFAAESYRRQRYAPVAGIFQFMFVESWPSINWGVVDYRRQPKPGYESMRLAYQPVLPSIEFGTDQFASDSAIELGLWIVNDLDISYAGSSLQVSLWQDDELLDEQTKAVDIQPDSSRHVESWKKQTLPVGRYVLRLRLADAAGKVLGTNRFHFNVTR